MPNRTFSPPSFSSTASSRTMFKKTYPVCQYHSIHRRHENSGESYIVASQDADDFSAAVQLDEQSLVEVLGEPWSVSECFLGIALVALENRDQPS